MIVITVEGGLVQGVSSDDPAELGKEVVVIDYDAEGADPAEIHQVPQGEGEAEDAVMGAGSVGLACIRAGMRYLGVEIEREHYEKARWRLHRAAYDGNGNGGGTAGNGAPANPLDAKAV